MVTAILLAHLADMLTFLLVLKVPGITLDMELNPVARYLYEGYGALGIFALKSVGLTAILLMLPKMIQPWRQRAFVVVVAIGLVGAAMNTLSGVLV